MDSTLDRFAQPRRELAVAHPSGKLVCVACAHRCKLADGARGVCLVRGRSGDALTVPWGYTAGVAIDPIEKKPFFHLLPGARALSFGMLGCDLHCAYCQNWFTSQTLRDPRAGGEVEPTDPETLVAAAIARHCEVVTSTYNEPLITSEWAHDVFVQAREAGLVTTFVSNGHATSEVLDYLAPVMDAYKVDLKSFSPKTYAALGGKLQAVLDTIAGLAARGIWVEVVTLIVPGLNDAPEELREIASFLASVSPDIPWHVTAFHPDYKMTGPPATPVRTLIEAADAGRRAGLRFVYAGNLSGRVGDLEDTHCPSCGTTLIRRSGFTVYEARVTAEGTCPSCGGAIPGRWNSRSQGAGLSRSRNNRATAAGV
ncbi:MAG: AmmeMemoRadiSam system radical SAM enzyme [Acidobacteriia bacterium]|nr:AmmeMemoRadiSam system radical SAM enzyme [Terriglobia bacterium]